MIKSPNSIRSGDYIEVSTNYHGVDQWWCGTVRRRKDGLIIIVPSALYTRKGSRWVNQKHLPRPQGFKPESFGSKVKIEHYERGSK